MRFSLGSNAATSAAILCGLILLAALVVGSGLEIALPRG